jgi:hypothetical protein
MKVNRLGTKYTEEDQGNIALNSIVGNSESRRRLGIVITLNFKIIIFLNDNGIK